MSANFSESSWLAREIERIPENDFYNLHPGPVEERSRVEDLIRQAKTESKEQDSAISKHLVKKAALEEKLKFWQLDSSVSNSIVDPDGNAVSPLQGGLAIEKRIRELKEASKQQDVAIQKHHVRKAALEREIKLDLDYKPEQPLAYSRSAAENTASRDKEEVDVTMPVVQGLIEKPARNAQGILCGYHEMRASCSPPAIYDFSSEFRSDHQAMSGDTVQEPKKHSRFKQTIKRRGKQRYLAYAQEGPASSGRSSAHWGRRSPSFGSVVNGMFKKFEQMAIGVWPARKSRDKSAVPAEESVDT